MFVDSSWNGLADLIANLITKYAGVLELDNLPDPVPVNEYSIEKNNFDIAKKQIENEQYECYNNLEIYDQTELSRSKDIENKFWG